MLGSAPPAPAPPTPARGQRARYRRPGAQAQLPPAYYAALEPLLDEVKKPAQYVGGEHNQQEVAWRGADSRWLLCYPDTYEVGQPNQGIQILYEVLNRRPSTLAERCYAPWVDLEERMRERDIPAFSLEAHRPLWAFDVLGVTRPHELGHTNLLNLLDLGRVPLHATERTEEDPIVLVGGHAAYNPEPLAPFIDAAVMGDGEEVAVEVDDVIAAVKRERERGATLDRHQLLRRLASVEGVIEGLLARGDRRVAAAVECAWRLGARFDGWHEMPTLEIWCRALAETGVDLDAFSHRERDEREALPWDHLDSGLEKEWLWEDWQDALSEKELDDCRWSPCYDCGVCPGLSIQHDTGYDAAGGAEHPEGASTHGAARADSQLPMVPSGLGGSEQLPVTPERYASPG